MHDLMSVAAGGRSLFQQGDETKVAAGAAIAPTIGAESLGSSFSCRHQRPGSGIVT
jgi:hypothetical protein